MATPALRALRKGFPTARITLAGTARIRQVLEPGRFHDAFLLLSGGRRVVRDARRLRRGRFDLGVLLPNSFASALALRLARVPRRAGYDRDGRGWLLTDRVPPTRDRGRFVPEPAIETYLRLVERLGCPRDGMRMELEVAPEDEAAAEAILRSAIRDPPSAVVVTPGASFGAAKLWPAERFAAVADHLADRLGAPVVVAAAPTEAAVARAVLHAMRHPAVNLAERGTSLGVLKAVIRRAAILVTNDSGPRHVAAAFDRPVVTIFGPTDPRWTEINHAKEIQVLPECECAPCQKRTCPTDHRCMLSIAPDRVIKACEKLLGRREDGRL